MKVSVSDIDLLISNSQIPRDPEAGWDFVIRSFNKISHVQVEKRNNPVPICQSLWVTGSI